MKTNIFQVTFIWEFNFQSVHCTVCGLRCTLYTVNFPMPNCQSLVYLESTWNEITGQQKEEEATQPNCFDISHTFIEYLLACVGCIPKLTHKQADKRKKKSHTFIDLIDQPLILEHFNHYFYVSIFYLSNLRSLSLGNFEIFIGFYFHVLNSTESKKVWHIKIILLFSPHRNRRHWIFCSEFIVWTDQSSEKKCQKQTTIRFPVFFEIFLHRHKPCSLSRISAHPWPFVLSYTNNVSNIKTIFDGCTSHIDGRNVFDQFFIASGWTTQ